MHKEGIWKIMGEIEPLLPPSIVRELRSVTASHGCGPGSLREIRLRATGLCSVVTEWGEIPLISGCSREQIGGVLDKITCERLHAYRGGIARGYLPLGHGVRVGLCGRAGYEGDRLLGVGDVSSVVFRLPFGKCGFARELYDEYISGGRGNLLIVSPPSGGKTTALRALAALVSSGEGARRTAVIDDREELDPEDGSGSLLDMIRGYRRSDGVEIALRALSAQVVIMDEIGSAEDVRAVMECQGAGVELIATAHGDGEDVFLRRPILRPLEGVFAQVAVLTRQGNGFSYEINSARCRIPVEC